MKWLLLILLFVILISLYLIVLNIGLHIVENLRKTSVKKWKIEIDDYNYERWKVKFYVTTIFIAILALIIYVFIKANF